MSSPSREARALCWRHRDAYFACLDRAGVVLPGKESGSTCGKERAAYENSCAKSWVEYFNQRRVLEFRQRAREEALAKKEAATNATQ